MSNAQDLGSVSVGGNFTYGGVSGTVSSYNIGTTGGFQGNGGVAYGGVASTMSSAVATNITSNTGLFQGYSGYGATQGVTVENGTVVPSPTPTDNQPVLTWPKNQQIYYKLVGFNTNTQSFETWIVAEEIVPRPETFDPTGNVPNVEYGVYFTPPSGNKLVNIKIVGRWIQ